MKSERRYSYVTVLVTSLIAVTLTGCNGKSKGGASLADQYKRAAQLPNADARAMKLLEVGTLQTSAGDANGADKSFGDAAKAAAEITSPSIRARVLADIAQAEGVRGKKNNAKKLLKSAKDAYKSIEKPHERIPAITTCAEVYALHLDSAAVGKGELRLAEDLIEQMDPPHLGIQAAGRIAACYFAIDAEQDGIRVLDNTVAKAEAMADPREKSDTLVAIAKVIVDTNKKEKGQEILTKAQETAATIDDAQSKGFALAIIAEALGAYGQKGKARALLDEATTLADKVDASLRGDLTDRIQRARKKI